MNQNGSSDRQALALPNGVTEAQARRFWLDTRKSLLEQVDAIERLLEITPRTAEIREAARQDRRASVHAAIDSAGGQ